MSAFIPQGGQAYERCDFFLKNKPETELLELLRRSAGFAYISDLHLQENCGPVTSALRKIEVDEFSLDEWKASAEYITGVECELTSRDEIREFLLDLVGAAEAEIAEAETAEAE